MADPAERPKRRTSSALVSSVLVVAWSVAVLIGHDDLYDLAAVGASIGLLIAAVVTWHWRAPAEWRAARGVVLACFGFGFAFCGMPVILRVRLDPYAAPISSEALSGATLANAVWAVAFSFGLLGALAVFPPRKGGSDALSPAAPRTPLLLAGMAGVIWLTMGVLAVRPGSSLRALGGLPMMLFPPTLIVPLLGASAALHHRNSTFALGAAAVVHLFLSLYTSMLGWVGTFAALLVLTYATLGTWPSRRQMLLFLGIPALILFVLNPVKAEVRHQRISDESSEIDLGRMLGYWEDALTGESATHDDESGEDRSTSVFQRTNYNIAGSPVFHAVPDFLPFEEGATYTDIPQMFVPRIVYPDKIDNNLIRSKWTVKLGVNSLEGSERTAVAIPAPAEAFWNFGWPGVAWVAFVLGVGCRFLLSVAPGNRIGEAAFAVMVGFTVANPTDMLFNMLPSIPTLVLGALLLRLLLGSSPGTRRNPASTGRIEQTPSVAAAAGAVVLSGSE